MGSSLMKAVRKNLFGILTLIVSAAVLLIFLFSSNGLDSLRQIFSTVLYRWLACAAAAAA